MDVQPHLSCQYIFHLTGKAKTYVSKMQQCHEKNVLCAQSKHKYFSLLKEQVKYYIGSCLKWSPKDATNY